MTRTAAVGLALALAAAASAVAQTPAPAPEGGRPDPCQRTGRFLTPEDRAAMGGIMMNRLKARLGLTDQQLQDIRIQLEASRDTMREDGRALCEARRELRLLMAQRTADPAALRAVTDRVKAAQARLLDRRLEGYLALRAKLTPEQWEGWIALRKEIGPRSLRHRHHHRGAMM